MFARYFNVNFAKYLPRFPLGRSKSLAKYANNYQIGKLIITVENEEDNLYASIKGYTNKLKLTPLYNNQFLIEDLQLVVSFKYNKYSDSIQLSGSYSPSFVSSFKSAYQY